MAGAGYKLFNTGDVLTAAQVNTYLMEQTVMVFADAAARTTALTGVVSEGMLSYLKSTKQVEVYNGSAWVASDDPNAIQNTIVDAKGDLITATAADTPARLAVGSNGDTLVADSAATTGLRWQSNFAAGKNKIINGDFLIWQRGTSVALTGPTTFYGADRFRATGVGNFQRQTFTPGTAPVAGYEGQFFARWNITSNSQNYDFGQLIEDARTFAGQTVTLSFWAKASVNTNNAFFPRVFQNFGTGGSPSSAVYTDGSGINLTTSWTRYTTTLSIPSVSGKTFGTNNNSYLGAIVQLNTTSAVDIDFWGWQLEANSVATAFQTATGTLQGELAACQRYYWRSTPGTVYGFYGHGFARTTTSLGACINHPVQMRVNPTSIDFSNLSIEGATSITAAAIDQTSGLVSSVFFTTAGMTTQYNYRVMNFNNTAGFLGFSAEL